MRLVIKNGLEDGLWERWHKNGKLHLEGHFKDGLKHGKYTVWHKNGQKAREEYFENELRQGEEKMWDEDGNISLIANWLDGEQISEEIEFDCLDDLIQKIEKDEQ